MKRFRRYTASALMVLTLTCVMCLAAPMSVFASDYMYTVTVSGGNQGEVTGDMAEPVKVAAGDTITIDPSAVKITNDKYYLKGFHVSGQESPVVQGGDIPNIHEDMDLVATYGIKQAMVKYTVRYVDENGAEILPSKVFYGNVDDKPVLAYTQIDGYKPHAYALTKRLVENSEKNIFVFSYDTVQAATVENENSNASVNESSSEDSDSSASADNNDRNRGTGNAGNRGNNGGNVFAGAGNVAAGNGNNTAAGNDNGPSAIVDLDNSDTPLANGGGATKELNVGLIAGCSAVAAAILALLIWLFMRRRGGEE